MFFAGESAEFDGSLRERGRTERFRALKVHGWLGVMLKVWPVAVLVLLAACGSSPMPTAPTGPLRSSSNSALTIAPVPVGLAPYERDAWKLWDDADGDCQDTRAEVLIEESLVLVLFRDVRHCVVDSGRWVDPYTNQTVTAAADLDIDHLVPLANAYRSGAWRWTSAQKERYANDLSYPWHLVAVTAAANRSKSDQGPESWRPPNGAFWCQYATAWIYVKQTWALTATPAEWQALQAMSASCSS